MTYRKRLKAEVLAVLCIALLWVVDLRTNCVPRAEAGVLRQAVKIAPNWENGYYALGWVYESYRNREKADEAYGRAVRISYEKAVEADPNNAEARFELARDYCYGDRNDIERAIEQYKAAARLDPNWFAAWSCLADAYMYVGNYEQAIEAYQRAIEIDSEDSGACHYDLAIAYLQTRKRDLALQEYQVLKDLGDERT